MTAPLRIGAAPGAAKALCVLVHGRGGSPEDMAALALDVGRGAVAFALPRAEGRAWYPARAVDPLTPETERDLSRALDRIDEGAEALRRDHGDLPLLVAGFSQGACVALEYALRRGPWAGGLAVLTGCRVGYPTGALPIRPLAGLPAFLSNGDADPWIPLPAFAAAVEALGRAGARLRADVMPGRDHAVSPTERGIVAGLLADLGSGTGAPTGRW